MSEELRQEVEARTKRYIDATELLLQDLHTYREEIRHKAGFRGCLKELDQLRDQVVNQLQKQQEDLRKELV